MRVTIEAFISSQEWSGPDEIDRLRIEDKTSVARPGPKKEVVVAEADIEANSLEDAAKAARHIYWHLRTSGMISDQSGGLLSVTATDENGQRFDPSMEAIVYRQSDKFFSATAIAGRLHMLDIGDHSPWDPARIAYTREREIDMSLPRMGAVKVRTVGGLYAEISRSQGSPGSISLYVHEDLLYFARRRWERMRDDLPQPAMQNEYAEHHGQGGVI